MKDSSDENPFPKLKELFKTPEPKLLSDYMPKIVYNCLFCKETALSNFDIWKHLRTEHNMEQPVLCFRCKQQFKITDLSGNRWKHECINKAIQNR